MSIIVTDLTRFHNKGLVCLAGIDTVTGACIRPFLQNSNGNFEYLTYQSVKEHKIIPGSYLNAEFTPKPRTHRPHTEDHIIASPIQLQGNSTSEEFRRVLEATSSNTIVEGFGSNPVDKYFAIDRPPHISIFTLKIKNPRNQFSLSLDERYGPAFKVNITDESGFSMKYLKVTDLGFLDNLEKIKNQPLGVFRLNKFLTEQQTLYIRIGLGQQFAPNNDESRRGFYVQVNGIYTFPNFRQDLRIYD